MSQSEYVMRILVLSTAHITEKTDKYLYNTGYLARDMDPGWLLSVPDGREIEEDAEQWEDMPEMLAIFILARMLGCPRLLLDPDADVHPNLPVFNW